MKNLLFFASDFQIGLSALLTDQLLALSKANVPVTAVAGEYEQEKGLSNLLKANGVTLNRIQGLDTHAEFNRLCKEIQELVIANDINIIHVQNNWQLAIVGMVKNKLRFFHKVEIVYTLHGFRHNHPVKAKIAQGVIGSALFLLADHVICMTDYLKKKFNLLSYKINLIPLGVKDSFVLPEFSTPPTDSLRLIFPAQFREGKNQDVILRTFADFIRKSGDAQARLTLPGNGPLLEEMKNLAMKLGIQSQVSFPGFVSKEDVKNLYLSHNVAIVASNSETFGQSIVEPFVLGRAVVSTPVGVALEIIKDGENGFIFKNESDLTSVLLKLNADKSALISMGKNNFEKHNQFSWAIITEKYCRQLL